MARNYAVLPHEYLEEMDVLNDAEFGRLCRALLRYSAERTPLALGGNERFFAKRVAMVEDRYQRYYDNLINGKSEAGKKGAGKRWQTIADDSTAWQTIANDGTAWQSMADDSKNGYTKTKTNTETDTKTKTKSFTGDNSAPPRESTDFERFWAVYPRHDNEKDAREAFDKALASHKGLTADALIQAVEKQKKSRQWTDDNGEYIPFAVNWLNREQWRNEMQTAPKKEGSAQREKVSDAELDRLKKIYERTKEE